LSNKLIEFLLEEEVPVHSFLDWEKHSTEEVLDRAEHWEEGNYIKVFSAIEKYLTIPDLGDGRHFVVEDTIYDVLNRFYDGDEHNLSQDDIDDMHHILLKYDRSGRLNYTELLEEAVLFNLRALRPMPLQK